MATGILDETALCRMTEAKIAQYFLALRKHHQDDSITAALITSTSHERIPPTCLCVWLSASECNSALLHALQQTYSTRLRKSAVRRFRHVMASPSWDRLWTTFGALPGMLQLLQNSSVESIQTMCMALGKCGRGARSLAREACLDDLVRALLPSFYSDVALKSADRRHLVRYYAHVVPACSPDFVRSVVGDPKNPLSRHVSDKAVLSCHPTLIQDIHFQSLVVVERDPVMLRYCHQSRVLFTQKPPRMSEQPHFTATMLYSLRVLRAVDHDEVVHTLDLNTFVDDLCASLTSRLLKRKADWTLVKEVFELVLSCLKAQLEKSASPESATWDTISTLILVYAKAWSEQPATFEDVLLRLLGMVKPKQHQRHFQLQHYLDAVPRTQRYSLLRTLLTFAGGDIDKIEELESLRGFKWTASMLSTLDVDHALPLLQRLLKAFPKHNFLATSDSARSILDLAPNVDTEGSGGHGHPLLLLALLQSRAMTETEVTSFDTTKAVEKFKTDSARSREQPERAHLARTAIFYAVASGSLPTLKTTLLWARRFVRDPLSIQHVFGGGTVDVKELIALLSGIPDPVDKAVSLTQVQELVEEANTILLELFDALCIAAKEPFYQKYIWNYVLALYSEVTEYRLHKLKQLCKILECSEEDGYNAVLNSTIRMLVEIERRSMESGRESVGVRTFLGPLGWQRSLEQHSLPVEPLSQRLTVYRFVDDLARARDALWKGLRLDANPDVADIPKPWCRGLPIQALTRLMTLWSLDEIPDAISMPFLDERVRQIVFMDFEDASAPLPDNNDMICMLLDFQDDYVEALRFLMLRGIHADERDKTFLRAFQHGVRLFQNTRTTPTVALRTMRQVVMRAFSRSLPLPNTFPTMDENSPCHPILPVDIEPGLITEWDPSTGLPDKIESESLEPVAFDYFILQRQIATGDLPSNFDLSPAGGLGHGSSGVLPQFYKDIIKKAGVTEFFTPAAVWRPSQDVRALPPPVLEGLIVSALLYLDSPNTATARLLSTPFPSQDSVRFPALFLDADFLGSSTYSPAKAVEILSKLLDRIPATLLDSLNTRTASTDLLDFRAREILLLLKRSDRPHLACSSIAEAIIEQPDASSWHRMLLSQKYLRRLSASDAFWFFTSFTSAILDKLKQQTNRAQASVESPGSGEITATPKESLVKVTTIKMLVKLLQYADFVPPDTSFDILSRLVSEASHIDIRVSTVESLLDILSKATTDHDSDRALESISVLERVVPIAGSLSERRPTRKSDWAAAEGAGVLPEIWPTGENAGPIFRALIAHGWSRLHDVEFMTRIVLPAVRQSIAANSRWIKLFLDKHGLADQYEHVPKVPFKTSMLLTLISSCAPAAPKDLLEEFHSFILYNISPPPAITALNARLKQEARTDESRHWLALFARGISVMDDALIDGVSIYLTLLNRHLVWPKEYPELDVDSIQRILLEQADAVLYNSDDEFTHWESFIAGLDPSQTRGFAKVRYWTTRELRTIARLESRILELRTDEWQDSPSRDPKFLPSTFKLRLWQIAQPPSVYSDKHGEVRVSRPVFSPSSLAELGQLLVDPIHFGANLAYLKKYLFKFPAGWRQQLARDFAPDTAALVTPSETTFAYMDVVTSLASCTGRSPRLWPEESPRDPCVIYARDEIAPSWKASSNESVRMMGFRLARITG